MKKDERALFESLRDLGPYFIGEGEEVVRSLFKSQIEVVSLLMEEHYFEKITIPAHVKVQLATRAELQKITGYDMHQGIMALGVKPSNVPLEEMQGAAVVLNGLANAENVGAVVRNAVAFGIRHLIVDQSTSPPYLRRSIKVSRGALFQMKVHITSNLPTLLKGQNAIATYLSDETPSLEQLVIPENPYFVFGREGTGIDKDVLESCSLRVKIPIDPIIDSLNVAVASGIILYAHQMIGSKQRGQTTPAEKRKEK